eukprot:1190184-Prorocentrum_minimum.AAC.4
MRTEGGGSAGAGVARVSSLVDACVDTFGALVCVSAVLWACVDVGVLKRVLGRGDLRGWTFPGFRGMDRDLGRFKESLRKIEMDFPGEIWTRGTWRV